MPHAVDVRDVFEHFDAYERGEGKLQKRGKVGDLLMWEEFDGASFTLKLFGVVELNLHAATRAAETLAGEALNVVAWPGDNEQSD